jgi:hypothetical protein
MRRFLVAAFLIFVCGCAAEGPFARREYEPEANEPRESDQRNYNSYDYPYAN